MKKIVTCLVILSALISCRSFGQNHSSDAFTYSGSNWQKYEGHKMTIVVLDTSVGRTKLIAEQVIKNGRFNVNGSIAHPQNAFFGLYNPNGDFVYKQEFIVEPGKLKIDRDDESNNIIVSGGKYNPIFYAINKDPEYIEKLKAFNDYAASLKREDFKNESVKKKYTELRNTANDIILDKYDNIRFHNPDPYARLLAIYHSNRSIKYDEQLNELEKELGPLPEIVYLRYSLNAARKRNQNRGTITVGSVIKDLNSSDINGRTFHLADVLKQNKYTLVEFWASWCGPCRAEIPHMKTAYQKFNKKGFEIVSFTLDHEEDRWKKASDEEKLPWINVGDLLAYKSPVVTMFGINGIPANYLVDPSGKIIAKDLRQEKLDEKLEVLLGN
jgi:thiol-disulfide isomerase/thioredoxin